MNAITQTRAAPRFKRIASRDVDAFIAEQKRSVQERSQAERIIARAQEQARRERELIDAEAAAFDMRIERQAEEIAEKQAQKFKAKQDAMHFHGALEQVAVIAKDYQGLDAWMTATIMAGVNAILGEMSDEERWARLITNTLKKTKERWQLQLLCHPDDHAALTWVVENEGLGDAISRFVRDETVLPGTCFLKGESDFFEINLSAQLDALATEIQERLAVLPEKASA